MMDNLIIRWHDANKNIDEPVYLIFTKYPLDLEAIRGACELDESEFRAALVGWLEAHSDYVGDGGGL